MLDLRQKLINSRTDSERFFIKLIEPLNLKCVFQKRYDRKNGRFYYPDFCFQITHKQVSRLIVKGWPLTHKVVKHRIIVEIDGLSHVGKELYDKQRQFEIENRKGRLKYHFLRFTNFQVQYRSQEVLDQFIAFCNHLWKIDLSLSGVKDALLDRID